MDVLNVLKQEFDLHPVDLFPDHAHSSATIAKAYLDAMGVRPPSEKFKIPTRIHGIAMEAYYGGRAECRVRRAEVPVMLTDFKSQYPNVNSLLGNWSLLIAKRLSYEDATDDVRTMLASLTLDQTFSRTFWRRLSVFALVRPQDDVLPVRSVYNGETRNIGINELSSRRSVWMAGPDLVADALLSGKLPHIEQAIRIVPHGRQPGLRPVALRSGIVVDPAKDDFFRRAVEEREKHKRSNPALAGFLKTLANAGSYGTFVEVTPKIHTQPVEITRTEGARTRRQRSFVEEQHGRWYCPIVGALTTAGGRLLLAMHERSVTDAGGTYLFCDTDSLCIVADTRTHLVPCPGGPRRLNGRPAIQALSRARVREIVEGFAALNPRAETKAAGSILKIETANFDKHGRPRRLLGFAISAKRYALYARRGNQIRMVAPKAHGLGYLYPPKARARPQDPPWTSGAWAWMVRGELGLPRRSPRWLHRPAMMRITASTPGLLARLRHHTRPFSFLLCPVVDPLMGYPMGVDRTRFTPIARFSKHADRWWQARWINIHDGRSYRLAARQSPRLDRIIPQTIASVLRSYFTIPSQNHSDRTVTRAPHTRADCFNERTSLKARATTSEKRPIESGNTAKT